MPEKCIPLKGSTTCPAFSGASISTDKDLVNQFSFLAFVSNVQDFDQRLSDYVKSDYVKSKYQNQLGCSNINLSNTSYLYARYTTSVVCSGIVQSSKEPCGLAADVSRPLCADTCALYATSEEEITVNQNLCGQPKNGFMDAVRSDFTICSHPSDSLTGSCISGDDNEPDECGYGSNLPGLCSFCGSSSPNSTDSCCRNADVTSRCKDVTLPPISSMPPLFPSSTSSPTAAATSQAASGGLSGGQIAGAVVGSVVGFALLAALGLLGFMCMRRRRNNQNQHVFNQPSPRRSQMSAVQYAPGMADQHARYESIPGGRVARMQALRGGEIEDSGSRGLGAIAGAGGKFHDSSDSDAYGDSPAAPPRRGPPLTGKRNGSLSSASILAGDDTTSPKSGSGGQFSSPEGFGSGQSEQLPYFRDYYSQDDIHPNDKVSTLWAYQPRAGDEFELERGDMLKIVGIWDDGWATGVRISERAEDYDGKHRAQRDSGVSNGTSQRESSPPPAGEIKAFPLVCVCLPEHWRKTIEADVHSESGDPAP